jgi:chromate transporter
MLFKLFTTFFRLGLFTIGGGYTALVQIERELIEDNNWITHDEFLEITAIARITPGPITINFATFIGKKVAGLPGSAVATVAVVTPPLVIISFISGHLNEWVDNSSVHSALIASRYAVSALIIHAAYRALVISVTTQTGRILFAVALSALILTTIHPLLILLTGICITFLLKCSHKLPEAD